MENNNTRPDGMVMQIVTSLLCTATGALLYFVPDINMKYMCYCFLAALILVGITLIVSYFVSEAYRKLNDYRFAIGVLLIILGCIELLRVDILTGEIMFIIGFVILILAVIIMQSTVQMKILKSSAWAVQLIFTIISMIGAIMVLADFKPVMTRVRGFAYIVMMTVGILCLISLIIEAFVLWNIRRKEAKAAKTAATENKEEGDATSTGTNKGDPVKADTEETAADEDKEKSEVTET